MSSIVESTPDGDDCSDSLQGFKTFRQERLEWERRKESDGQPEGAGGQEQRAQELAASDVPESEEELAAEQESKENLADEHDFSEHAFETTERLTFSRAPAREPRKPKSGYALYKEDKQTAA